MSAIVCGKRSSIFEDLPSSPPISKRIRCSSSSPVRFSPLRPTTGSPFDLSSSPSHLSALDYLSAHFPDMDKQKKNWLKSHPEIFNPIVKQTGGTCFAVAALTLCEVMYALQYGEKIQLSIEDILNSFHKGQVRDVLQYVHEHGVSLQIRTGQKLYIDSFTYCKRMNENDVLKELDMHPVCGVIHSSSCLIRMRPGEIYQGSKSSDGPLHALLIVGYGSYNGVNFYLVRNSWGTTWCSNGYGMNPNSMFVWWDWRVSEID